MNGGLTIWKRGYPEIIGKHGKFSKSKKFTEQAETKKVVSRMIVRYSVLLCGACEEGSNHRGCTST